MNISRKDISKTSAILTIDVTNQDYGSNVEKVLKDYKKRANIPGFRKGHTPFGLIKKQYGLSVKVDEINKLVQKKLHDYLTSEKISILGNPILIENKKLSWTEDDLSFDFELGLKPDFKLSFKNKKSIKLYEIEADKKMIDDQIKNIQNQYGKLVSTKKIEDHCEISGTFQNEEHKIENSTTFKLDDIKNKSSKEQIIKMKIKDQVQLSTKDLFKSESDLKFHLKATDQNISELHSVFFNLSEINKRLKADLNQELFDKLYGKDKIRSVIELKERLKSDAEKSFANQSDQKLINDINEHLISETKINLPENFLKKWIQNSSEKKLSEREAEIEYDKSQKGLKYQLIESKIIEEHNLKIDQDEIVNFSKQMISNQMAQYGQTNPDKKELESISKRILSNKDEQKRLYDQLLSEKLLKLYKKNLKFKKVKVSYKEFIEMAYTKK